LVDAKISLDLSDDSIDEGDILATRVGPTVVESVWSNEDGTLRGESTETIVPVVAGNIIHRTSTPMDTKDETVCTGVVIVVWNSDDVLALLAIDCERFGSAGKSWVLSATLRSCAAATGWGSTCAGGGGLSTWGGSCSCCGGGWVASSTAGVTWDTLRVPIVAVGTA
jgi:hypothetical protein